MSATAPRIAFLITSHKLPGQLARLVRRIRADLPAAAVAVHHDPTGTPLQRDALRASGALLVPDPAPVRWGTMAELSASLEALDWCRRELDPDWVVLLSGQDYPARPLRELERHLAATSFDGFLEGIPVVPPAPLARALGRGLDEFASRYFFRYVRVPVPVNRAPLLGRAWGSPRVRAWPWGEVQVGLPRLRTPFTTAAPCRRGSAWCTLSRRAVAVLCETWRERADLRRYYARTVLPGESFAQTVLHAQPGLALSGDYGRYTRWERPSASNPAVLRLGDLPRITASGAFFARKFDEGVDAAVLDALDRHLDGGAAPVASD